MPAAVVPFVRVINLRSGAVLGESTLVESMSITRGLDGEETLSVSLPMVDDAGNPNPAAQALVNSTGGVNDQGTLEPLLLALSLDGGANIDARKAVEHPTLTLDATSGATVSEQGNGLWAGYARVLVDRVTFNGVTFGFLVDGAAGSLGSNLKSGQQGIGNPALLGNLKGYMQTEPGPPRPGTGTPTWAAQDRLRLGAAVDSSISGLYVDADENASPIDAAVATALTAVSGTTSSDGLGVHAHLVVDSSDPGAGNIAPSAIGSGWGGAIAVGLAGTDSGLTFHETTYLTDPSRAYDPTHEQILDPLTREPDLTQVDAGETLIGGLCTHGLPESATIVGIVCINGAAPMEGTTAWNASLPIVAARDAQGFGGVYFLVEHTAYPFSQQLNINDLWLDVPGAFLYAATANGVYRAPATLSGTQTPMDALAAYCSAQGLPGVAWERIGGNRVSTPSTAGLVSNCRKVIAANGTIVAHATSGNVVGLFLHPARSGDTHGVRGGYDGWSSLHPSASIIDFAYSAAGDELVFADSDGGTTLVLHAGISAGPGVPVLVDVPIGSTITGIDKVPGGYVVRTLDGANGLYWVPTGGTAMTAIGAGLVDEAGNPVMVNRTLGYPDPFTPGGHAIAGTTVYGFACTDSGVFYSTTALSAPTWVGSGAQTGLGAQNVTLLAAGYQRSLINRLATCVYASTGASLYASACDGLYYDDILAEKVTLEAFFLSAAAQCSEASGAPFPPTDTVALATDISGIPYVGTPGNTWTLPSSIALPKDFAWVSPLDERNRRTYRLVNFGSASPYFGLHAGEVPEIEATSSTLPVAAATRLGAVMVRRVKEYSRAQYVLTLTSAFAFADSLLRRLRPSQTALVTIDRTAWGMNYSADTFYVLRHTISFARGDTVCRTQMGRLLRNTAPSDSQIAAALGYATKQSNRYATGKRA